MGLKGHSALNEATSLFIPWELSKFLRKDNGHVQTKNKNCASRFAKNKNKNSPKHTTSCGQL